VGILAKLVSKHFKVGTLLCQVLLLAIFTSTVSAQNSDGWHPVSSQPSKALDGNVEAMILWDDGTGPALIAGGDFVTAGWQASPGVARWDGVSWTPLGTGLNGTVRALAVFRGELIATGDFTQAGTRVVNRIARWNGNQWLPLDTGLSARGRALLVANSQLYAGGEFLNAGGQLVNRVARWDGSNWSPMSDGFINGVWALHAFAGDVYAGGVFGGGVARWNGSSWVQLPAIGAVFAMTTFNSELIAGGSSSGGVFRWNGTSWMPMGISEVRSVRTLVPYGNGLVAGGRFNLASNFGRNVALWNGSNWVAFAPAPNDGVSGPDQQQSGVNALLVQGQTLIVGGDFTTAGNIGAAAIARWNQGWTSFATGITDSVDTVGVHDGRLIAGGTFTSVPGTANGQRIGAWDGSNWAPFDLGFPGPGPLRVIDLTTYRNQLVAAGPFLIPGAPQLNGIARWNGSAWISLGSGVSGVQALAVFETDLVATGGFSVAGGVNANGWALWDGNDWRSMTALNAPSCGVRTLGGVLYGCGNGQVARFQNGGWVPLGQGFIRGVNDIALFNGELYAAGNMIGGLFRWTGSTWLLVPGVGDFEGDALTIFNGQLVVAGRVLGPNNSSTSVILRLGPNGWEQLGLPEQAKFPGQPLVSDLEVFDSRLVAAGIFSGISGESGVNLMAYGARTPTTVAITELTPSVPVLGQQVEVTVRVQSGDGAPRGLVSVLGTPRGVCSADLVPLEANVSVARCTITYNVVGPVQLQAQYSGGSFGGRAWLRSSSTTLVGINPGDFIFRDGFEGSP
jgi:trimeric autotransporter adhesin